MCTNQYGPEELSDSPETVEQLVAQCDEFILDKEEEEPIEELTDSGQTVEQILNQLDDWT